MINFSALNQGLKLQDYGMCVFSNLINSNSLTQLCASYPSEEFKTANAPIGSGCLDTASSYDFEVRGLGVLKDDMEINNFSLEKKWVDLIRILMSKEYLSALENKTGIKVTNKRIKIEFGRFQAGHFIAPHYDTEKEKVLVQVFYFNEEWERDWGGCFNILTADQDHSVALALPPLSIYSVTIVPASTGWHEVMPVTPLAKQIRKTMQLLFFEE